MGSQRIEFESEAWYRAVAEGRAVGVSDRRGMRPDDARARRVVEHYRETVPPVTAGRWHPYR